MPDFTVIRGDRGDDDERAKKRRELTQRSFTSRLYVAANGRETTSARFQRYLNVRKIETPQVFLVNCKRQCSRVPKAESGLTVEAKL